MSAEIRDKRKNKLTAASVLEPADHIMVGNTVYVVRELTKTGVVITSLLTGATHVIPDTDMVQQVHVIIEVHLV